jgi:hypothetical protein
MLVLVEGFDYDLLDIGCRKADDRSDFRRFGFSMEA